MRYALSRIFALVMCSVVFFYPWSARARDEPQKTRIVLLGASIGQAWDLPGFPARVGDTRDAFEFFPAWQYDKSQVLNDVLMRPKRKFHFTKTYFVGLFKPAPQPPNVIILKECSSYFPGDMTKYQAMMEHWVQEIRNKHIEVVLATVVPVTKARSARDPGKMAAIRQYNDWVRRYAGANSIPVLDLETALRDNSRERFLRDDLTSGDGSHLNKKAYAILDALLKDDLCRFRPDRACNKQASVNSTTATSAQ